MTIIEGNYSRLDELASQCVKMLSSKKRLKEDKFVTI